jgi:hypothetical protein
MALTKVGKEGITGISNSSDATAITIDSSEKVGIGTTSPTYQATVFGSSQSTVEIESGSDTGESRLYFTDPTTTGVGTIEYHHNGNTMRFQVNSAERMRLTANGLTFNGDTAAANALSDYEEGTFTPSVSGGYGSAPSYNAQTGIYIKIGKLVLAHIRIAVASGSRGGSALTFVGLPFANQSTIDGGGFVVYQNNFHSTGEFYPMVNANTATVFFHEANGTGITADELDADNYDIRIAVVYQTA